MDEAVKITTPFIKLDALLKFSALSSSGGEAKELIAQGEVLVNGQVELRRGRKLYPGDAVSMGNMTVRIE